MGGKRTPKIGKTREHEIFGKMGVSKKKAVLNIPDWKPFDERSLNQCNKIPYIMLRIGTERAIPQSNIVQGFYLITLYVSLFSSLTTTPVE